MEPITSTTTLTPTTRRQGVPVATRPFKITDIPDAMDKMNWPVAAALMRHWFNGKPWPDTVDGGMDRRVKDHTVKPPSSRIEESIVTMEWALKFPEVQEAIAVLRRAWNNAPALLLAREKISQAFKGRAPGLYPLRFDRESVVEQFGYFNSRAIRMDQFGTFRLNELRGALANFNCRVFGEGEVAVERGRILVSIRRLGFYIEDTYDFVDDGSLSQPLGYWGFDGVSTKPLDIVGSTFIGDVLPFWDGDG